MKTTVVPAQVTTVEDKIAGNLNFTQLLLLTTPVFLSGALFAFLPSFMNMTSYKIVICAVLVFVFASLAIRIKGKILLVWISIISRYNLRPRYYIFDKNSSHLREHKQSMIEAEAPAAVAKTTRRRPLINIPTPSVVRIEDVIADPRAKFHLKVNKKGGLGVYIQEIKQ